MMSVKVLLALILVLNIYREQEHERLTEESTEMMQEQNKLLKITLVLTTGRGLGG